MDATCVPKPASRRRFILLGRRVYRRVPEYCTEQLLDLESAKSKFAQLVASIMTLDVIVVYFTGRLDPVTLVLIPRGWFRRFIFTGLAVQFLLHPGWSFIGEFIDSKMAKLGAVRFLALVWLLVEVGFYLLQEKKMNKKGREFYR